MISMVWVWWQFWRIDKEDSEPDERYHYEELDSIFDGLSVAEESDDEFGSDASSELDGVETIVKQWNDEDINFELQMYEALSSLQFMWYI